MRTLALALILGAALRGLAAGTAAEHDTEFFTSRVQGQAISNLAVMATNLATAASNLAVQAASEARTTAYTGVVFVATNGNDATATPGDPLRPYKLLQTAVDAGAKHLVLGSGEYAGFTTTAGWTGSVAALGPVYIDAITAQSGLDGRDLSITGSGRGLIHIHQVSVSGTGVVDDPGGNGGTVSISGVTLDWLQADGGSVPELDYATQAYPGGNGGVAVANDCLITGLVTAHGGGGGDTSEDFADGGTGGIIALTNCTVLGAVAALGGTPGNTGGDYYTTAAGANGGHGGSITVDRVIGNADTYLHAYGQGGSDSTIEGQYDGGNGGNGGYIAVRHSSIAGTLNAQGNSGATGGNSPDVAGNGGNGGNAGTIAITQSTIGGNWTLTGGGGGQGGSTTAESGGTNGTGGNGGNGGTFDAFASDFLSVEHADANVGGGDYGPGGTGSGGDPGGDGNYGVPGTASCTLLRPGDKTTLGTEDTGTGARRLFWIDQLGTKYEINMTALP